jgi:predicted ABC-type ATPase
MTRLLLFVGPNGSGKSTITSRMFDYYGIPPQQYINADEIAKTLTEGTQEERERAAFRHARNLRQEYRQRGQSFAFETVFSHPSTLIDMQECRKAGFDIVVLFVTTQSVEINIARVARRFQSGGHDVPLDKIRSRYERVMGLLPRIIEETDQGVVYDNSESPLRIFPFQQGDLLPSEDTMRPFLVQRMQEPLAIRQREREKFGDILLPNEASATYNGKIITVGKYYTVQETKDGLMRHDKLLLLGTPIENQNTTIMYKDMQGILADIQIST